MVFRVRRWVNREPDDAGSTLQSRADVASAALLNVGLQEQSLHLAAFDPLLLLDSR